MEVIISKRAGGFGQLNVGTPLRLYRRPGLRAFGFKSFIRLYAVNPNSNHRQWNEYLDLFEI